MKAIIFDFNGTMIFDTKMNDVSWRALIRKYTGRTITDEEMSTYVHGLPNDKTIRHFINSSLTYDETQKYSEEKEELYRASCLEEKDLFKLVKGLEPLLDRLKNAGIPMTIATTANRSNVDFYFEKFGLSRWFSIENVVLNDGTLPGKPEPDMYLRACKNLNTKPADCIVAEDSPVGLLAARRAGIGKIIAIVSTLDAESLRNLKLADAVIEDFEGFEKIAGLV